MDDHANEYGRTESQRVIDETGFLSWIDVELEETADGRAELSVRHRDELTNWGSDVVHGGVVATLVDNAGGCALRTVLADPEAATYATSDLNVSYLRPATGDLRAEAIVRRAGSSMAVIQVDVASRREADDWVDVAVGRATYFVVDDGSAAGDS